MTSSRPLRFIAVLASVTVLGPLATYMFVPALPAVQRDFAASVGLVQLTFSLAMLAFGVATLIFGPLSDRFGRKPILLVGVALFLVGSVVSAVADNILVLIAGRLVQAGGSAAGIVLARAMARDVLGFGDSVRVISYLTMMTVVATMLSPTLGGFLASSIGWRVIFWFMGGVGLFAAVAIVVAMAETHPARAPAGWRGLVAGVRILSVSRVYLGFTLATASTYAVFYAFLAAAPYLLVEALHQPAQIYGIWFIPVVSAFFVGTYWSTRLLNHFEADRLICWGTIGIAITTIASVPLYFLLPLSVPLLFIPIIVVSFLQGFIIPNAQASAINVEPEYAGAGSGLVSFVQMATGALVVQAVAQFADGTVRPMLAFMVFGAIAGLLSLMLIKKPSVKVGRGEL